MGPPPRSPAAEANDCFMVQVPPRMDRTEYKVAARKAPGRRLPSDHRSTEEECEDRRQALTERVPYKAVWLYDDPAHGEVLIDGRNRWRACEAARVQVRT